MMNILLKVLDLPLNFVAAVSFLTLITVTYFLCENDCFFISAAFIALLYIYIIYIIYCMFNLVRRTLFQNSARFKLSLNLCVEDHGSFSLAKIHQLKGLDYGSGMACSYFYGYLQIVLPHSGVQCDKGLRESVTDYESKNNVKFQIHKLFILVPLSLYCPHNLDNEFSPTVEESSSLESKKLDRAGVKNRSYKISVYKITQGQNKIYVAAEYATPVRTLYDVMQHSNPYSDIYRNNRMDLVSNFYHTLCNLLHNDSDCRNMCEVIYYNDKNKKGGYYDIGRIILLRIKHVMENN